MLPTFSAGSDPQLSLAGQRWLETPMLSSMQSQQHPPSCKKSKALLSAAVLQFAGKWGRVRWVPCDWVAMRTHELAVRQLTLLPHPHPRMLVCHHPQDPCLYSYHDRRCSAGQERSGKLGF